MPRDSTRAQHFLSMLDFIIEIKVRPHLGVGVVKHTGALMQMALYLTTLSSQHCKCQ